MSGEGTVERSRTSTSGVRRDGRRGWLVRAARLGREAASIGDRLQREPVRFLAYALIATSFVFITMPWIDLAVSGWFASPGGDFGHARDPILLAIRDVNRRVPQILLPVMAAILLAHVFGSRSGGLVRPHQALFVLGVYSIGSGLVVSLLKDVVGRARPEDTIPFGGTAPYTVPWQIAEACTRNCSFSSGEAGSAAAMLSCVMLAPPSVRQPLFWSLVPIAMVFSLLRVAFGKHFASDVVVSWLLVALVAVVLWRWLSRRAEMIDRAITGSGRPSVAEFSRRLRKAIARLSQRRAGRHAAAVRGVGRKPAFVRPAG